MTNFCLKIRFRELPVNENHPKDPTSPYGDNKLVIETILRNLTEVPVGVPSSEGEVNDYPFRAIPLRYFNACGAHPSGVLGDLKIDNLIPIIFKRMSEGKGISIFGNDYDTRDGTCIRDYIDVNDLISAHVLAIQHLLKAQQEAPKTSLFEPINLGTGTGTSVKEIVDMVKEVTGVDFEVKIAPRRAGDPSKTLACNKKAKEVLGWENKFGLRDSIGNAWKFITGPAKEIKEKDLSVARVVELE